MSDPPGFPFVAQANRTQFSPGHFLDFPCIRSRAVVGCHAGRGTITLMGTEYPLEPGLLYLLPWEHAIAYHPDPRDPYFVFGMHVIPWQAADQPLVLSAPHDREDPLFDAPWRRPCAPGAQPPAQVVIATSEAERPGLAALSRYVLERFLRGRPDAADARSMGTLVLSELDAPTMIKPQEDPSLPAELRGLLVWIIRHLGERQTLADMAAVMECSPARLTRQFRHHLGCSPMEWVIQQRIERAQHLLASGGSTVSSIARTCGFRDPAYFSRLFKRRVGVTPREWRLYRTI